MILQSQKVGTTTTMGMDPPQFLHPGDTVQCEIEGIGTLTNTVR